MAKDKRPFEANWTQIPYTKEEINPHIQSGGNYGVICGYGNLAVVDSDTPELQKAVEQRLPVTFRVKTGSGGMHNYFFIPDLDRKIVLKTVLQKTEKHWGEVQSHGSQVVGPGSIHPNGNRYEAHNNEHISRITYEELLSAIKPFMKQVSESYEQKGHEVKSYGDNIDNLRVQDIMRPDSEKSRGNELYGKHPVHGSETGMNYWINTSKNVWNCFRCNSGGGPLAAIGVKEGVIDCSDAQPGKIRGDKVKEILQKARQSYGLQSETVEQVADLLEDEKLNLWTFRDFENLEYDDSYLVERIIYPKTTTMLYSPPGEFKSILSVQLALAVASGQDWYGFKTEKCPVLYCDKENNDQIIKERLQAIHKGMKIDTKDLPLYILRKEGDFDDEKFLQKMKKAIEEHQIKIIFFDTLHRFGNYEENSSDDINKVYSHVFQPLIRDYGVSIVFLHHTNKNGGFRGSIDLLGMVDTCFRVTRQREGEEKTNRFELFNEKSRSGEIDKMKADLEFYKDDDDNLSVIRSLVVDESEEKKEKKDAFVRLLNIIKHYLHDKDWQQKADIEAYLNYYEIDYSNATLKRCLKWMREQEIVEYDDKRHRYRTISNQQTPAVDDIDMSED